LKRLISSFYCSPNIIAMIKSMRMRLSGLVARMWMKETPTGFWWDIQKRPLGRPRIKSNDKMKMNLIDVCRI
jgi:hypothetical protein